ncbi:hypothetical protein K438DRAFT_1780567 [Mycena galopus ATCC 62051]|nr:hypothetical protein K438DRAFT_1780567 [Mycena galopus ATCC 62051]
MLKVISLERLLCSVLLLIWTLTTTANAVVSFRKDFSPPVGKALIGAEVIMAATGNFTSYVNGDFAGSGADRSEVAQRFCVDLLPGYNVFAVEASTTASTNGGLIATILVTYAESTTSTIVSDGTLRISPGSPPRFEQLSFDVTAWTGPP